MAATDTASFTENAMAFFDAVETGKGWEACSAYCDRDATFEAQADALADVHTLRDYAEWMKGMLAVLPDARYELKSFAVDAERQNVAAYAVFHGTHSGDGQYALSNTTPSRASRSRFGVGAVGSP